MRDRRSFKPFESNPKRLSSPSNAPRYPFGQPLCFGLGIVLGVVLILSGPTARGQVRFKLSQTLPTESRPTHVVSRDWNEDGNLDLATSNLFGGSLSLFLGDGLGEFAIGTPIDTDRDPVFLASGDFNEDDHLDLAATVLNGSGIEIYLGTGDGNFLAGSQISTGSNARSCAVLDIDGDLHLDLAVVNLLGGSLSLLTGDGNGNFSVTATLSTGIQPRDVISGDFDENGNPDLAFTNRSSDNLYLYLGNGVGGFAGPTIYPTGEKPTVLIADDFDEDLHLDLAIGHDDSSAIFVFLGDGTGSLGSPLVSDALFTGARGLVSRDFDQDLDLDLGLSAKDGNRFVLLLGSGDGNFQASTQVTVTQPTGLTSEDFDGDNRPDFVIAHTGGGAEVYLNQGSCAQGTVNAATGTIVDVLFANHSSGDLENRVVCVAPGEPIVYRIESPPSRAGLLTRYVVWEWDLKPAAGLDRELPFEIGATCLPSPITDPDPSPPLEPSNIWNTIGFRQVAGFPTHPSNRAPTNFFTYSEGLAEGECRFIQGLTYDFESAGDVIVSVTNGITIKVVSP